MDNLVRHEKQSQRNDDGTSEDLKFWLDFKDIVGLNVKYLYTYGLIMPSGFKDACDVFTYMFRVFLFVGVTYLQMCCSELINVFLNLGHLSKLVSASYLFLTHFVQMFKCYYMYKSRNRLEIFLRSINSNEFQPKSKEQQDTLKKYIHLSKMITVAFWSACIATYTFWIIGALTAEDPFTLPLAGWYPFDIKSSPGYEIAFVYQIISGSLNGLANISMDTLMSGLIMVICAQLSILNDTLVNIRIFALKHLEKNSKRFSFEDKMSLKLQENMDNLLVNCVVHHKLILDFAEEFTKLFSVALLGQLTVSVIIICLTLFEMTVVPFKSYKFISLVLYQYCMLLEIFLLCYFGNEVIIKSNKLTEVAYHSDWLDCSVKYKKNLVFFMTRSQRVLKLYAGGFFTLSLDTFVRIVKSSWSYFAVLFQVNNK